MTTSFAATTNTSIVDRLGEVKAQIADLQLIEKRLVSELKEQAAQTGEYAIDGSWFRASISEVAPRSSLDVKAAEAKLRQLGVDGRWFAKNQKITAGYTAVRIAGRKAS